MSLKTFQSIKKEVAANRKLKHLSDGELHVLQQLLLEMLVDFDALCKRNGLTYILTGGSALGAVRHGGFIPWDDDVDVLMPRQDYDRLAACVEKELSEKYWVEGLETSPVYDLNLVKFRRKGTRCVEISDTAPETAGVFIDVFALDDDYDHPLASFLYGVVNEWLFLMASCVRMYQKKEKFLQYFDNTPVAKSIRLKSAIGCIFHSRKNPRIWYERCERWSKRIHRPQSEYVAVSAGRGHYFGERYRREALLPPAEICFEGHSVKTARNSDYFLHTLFGSDYMQEVREEDREHHGYTAVELGKGESPSA